MNKRSFLKKLAITTAGLPLPGMAMANWIEHFQHIPPTVLAANEDFWSGIRAGYKLKPEYINLENGYYNFLPETVLESFIGHVREINLEGSYYMRTVQFDNKKNISARLAGLGGCSAEELIVTRNTTELLDMIIGGYHWQPGDEAIMAMQDYGAMLEMFKLAAKRFGVVNKIVSIPNHPASDDELVNLYANAITPKTKLLMIPHMVNITGQILPVQKICDMAHNKGVEVMVDGAHAFAHIQYKIDDLHCDYYGASLHKWLSTPLGAGMLYVKKGKAEKIWPLLAEGDRDPNDITRLNHTGTHPVHTDLAIHNAIDYYEQIGAARKEERLRWLQHYWTDKSRQLPGVIINTPTDSERSCGIANVGIKGMKAGLLAETLMKKYKIFTVAIDFPEGGVQGCRITPNIYTTPQELDILVNALKELGGVKS